MSALFPQAQALVLGLKTLISSIYQQDSLQALLGLFSEAQGFPLNTAKLSQFLNEYKLPTRQLIRAV